MKKITLNFGWIEIRKGYHVYIDSSILEQLDYDSATYMIQFQFLFIDIINRNVQPAMIFFFRIR